MFRVLLFVCALFFAPTSASAQIVAPHCAPDCNACPSCIFCGQDCTLTQGYWKNHTECWPLGFDPGTTKLCGILWIDILNTPVMGRPWYSLAHQWIAASLNQANGADADCIDCSSCIEGCSNALATVADLLINNCATMNNKGPNATFQCLVMLLDDYNMGMLPTCPEHCGGENPCQNCDCGLCCPHDCMTCLDCPDICAICQLADCPENVCCPDPCPPCPDCLCEVINITGSSSSSSSSSHHRHRDHKFSSHKKRKLPRNDPKQTIKKPELPK